MDYNYDTKTYFFCPQPYPTVDTIYGIPVKDILDVDTKLRAQFSGVGTFKERIDTLIQRSGYHFINKTVDELKQLKADTAQLKKNADVDAAELRLLKSDLKASQEAGYAKDAVISADSEALSHWRKEADKDHGIIQRLEKELHGVLDSTAEQGAKMLDLKDKLETERKNAALNDTVTRLRKDLDFVCRNDTCVTPGALYPEPARYILEDALAEVNSFLQDGGQLEAVYQYHDPVFDGLYVSSHLNNISTLRAKLRVKKS